MAWEWKNDSGTGWNQYTAECCATLEREYQNGIREVSYFSSSEMYLYLLRLTPLSDRTLLQCMLDGTYYIDFGHMTQTNVETETKRQIQRGGSTATVPTGKAAQWMYEVQRCVKPRPPHPIIPSHFLLL